jgi:hypothetical protein
MTDRPSDAERLSEISRLSGVLAERVLDAQIMSEPIQDLQIKALLDAALLLEEYAVPLPPLLTQILHEVSDDVFGEGGPDDTAPTTELDAKVGSAEGGEGSAKTLSFSRLLRPFRGSKP